MSVNFRLFVMMALQLAILGSWTPKLYPYMTLLGFDAGQMTMVGLVFGIAAIVGMFFSNQIADRYVAAEKVLFASHLAGAVLLMGVAYASSFWAFFLCFLAFGIVYVPTFSLTNSLALAHLRNPAKEFGPVRMGGTVGWMLVGWPFLFLLHEKSSLDDLRWIFIVGAILSLALSLFSLTLPHTPSHSGPSTDNLAWRGALRQLRRPFMAVLFLATMLDSVIHNSYFMMADSFLTDRVGIAGNVSMLVLSIGQAAEIATMMVLGVALSKLGWKTTLIIGTLGHAMRYLTFAFLADYVWVIVAAQIFHGICYAFFFATLYIFIDTESPGDLKASIQGLFNLVILGIGSVLAGLIFPQLLVALRTVQQGPDGPVIMVDYTTLFLVPTALSLLAAGLLLFGFRPPHRFPPKQVTDDPEIEAQAVPTVA